MPDGQSLNRRGLGGERDGVDHAGDVPRELAAHDGGAEVPPRHVGGDGLDVGESQPQGVQAVPNALARYLDMLHLRRGFEP